MRKKVVTKRPSYREAVQWIALNDNAGDDRVPAGCRDGQLQRKVIDSIAGYISTLLVADLFGAEPLLVATDIFRERQIEEGNHKTAMDLHRP